MMTEADILAVLQSLSHYPVNGQQIKDWLALANRGGIHIAPYNPQTECFAVKRDSDGLVIPILLSSITHAEIENMMNQGIGEIKSDPIGQIILLATKTFARIDVRKSTSPPSDEPQLADAYAELARALERVVKLEIERTIRPVAKG